MIRRINIQKNLRICSIVVVLALLLFAGTASAFTYSSADYSVSPTGSLTPGDTVTASMIVSYSDGSAIPTQLNLDSNLAGVSWTVVRNPGTSNAMTFHPAYPYAYVSNFDIFESSGSVSLKIIVTGTVSSDSVGKYIIPLRISESGGSGSIYQSPSQYVTKAVTTLPTSVVNQIPSQVTKGNLFVVSGITTGHTNENVAVDLRSAASTFTVTTKENSAPISLVTKIGNDGVWSVVFDTSKLNIDDYIVTIAVGTLKPVTEKIKIVDGYANDVITTPTVTSVPTVVATAHPSSSPSSSTLEQPTSSPTSSKSTFDPTVLIIIISALVVIIAGTVIIVRLTKRPKKTKQITKTTVEQKEIHVHINGNFYSDVGVVASDNAIVNRATVTNESTKKCPYCGAELKNDDKFCSKCGKQL